MGHMGERVAGMGRLNLWFGEVERFQARQSRAWWLGLTTGRRRQEVTEKPGCLAGAQRAL